MGLEVKVLWQHAGTDKLFLKDSNKVEQVLGLTATDVINGIGGHRQAIIATLALGGSLHHAHNALYDIIYIGEVATAVAIVEYLDGFALQQLVGKAKVGHIGTTGRTIDGEEAQTCRGDVIQLGVAMGHELVALLGGCIKAHGVIHAIVGREGHLLIAAIHGAAAGVHQVLHAAIWLRADG